MSADPLTAAVFDQVPPPTQREIFFGFIPIIGWSMANHLSRRRYLPAFEEVERVLNDRGKPLFSYSEGSPQALVSQRFLAALEDHGFWLAPNFGPEDALEVVLASNHHVCDPTEALENVRDWLGLPRIDVWGWDYSGKTFGQLIEELCAETASEKFDPQSPHFVTPYVRPRSEPKVHRSFRLTR